MVLNHITILRERVNLRTLLIALGVAGLGIGLLYISSHKEWWKNYEAWQTVIRDIGGLMLVTVAITVLWSLWGKRAFLDEILAKTQLSKEITFAGISKITDFYLQDIDWKSLFHTVNKLDIFFAYGQVWRKTYLQELREVAARKGARIRVVLPDPEDKQAISELARRFCYTIEDIIKLIKDAESDFRRLRSSAGNNAAQIDIWFLPAVPLFSFYRFDNLIIFSLYSHRRERVPVPTFVCELGGTLYSYIRDEFEAMIRPGGLARHITSE